MPTRISEVLGISRDQLENKGVYDAMIDYDSRLHIDPALIEKCRVPEFNGASKKITEYFNNVLKLLKASKRGGDSMWRTALKLLTFGEGLNTGLGYSVNGTSGSGIGPQMAERINDTVKEIVDAGTSDPAIFELVPVFEERIGADRISDMTSIILSNELHAFTNRIAKELNVEIPHDTKGRPLVFVPKAILSDLPISEQWEDVSISTEYNEGVRGSLNNLIGKSWKKVATDTTKQQMKELIVKYPSFIKELLDLYKKRKGREYDFEKDHMGIMLWDIIGPNAAEHHPLDLSNFKKVTADSVFDVVILICNQYKKLIEHNGLVEHLYDSGDDRRPERFPQLLLYAIADSYCKANNLDLSREINAGSGALDFKISSGLAKVNVEIKYSSNPKLVEGYEKQLITYNAAEEVPDNFSVYLILRVNKNMDRKIQKIKDMIRERNESGIASPSLIIVDAIIKPSASKR